MNTKHRFGFGPVLLFIGTALLLSFSCNTEPDKTHTVPMSVDLGEQEVVPLTQFADPLIGTGGHGHTYPGATLPFGMVQLSPDTRLSGWDGCSGYHNSDSIIYGFSHTHLSGTGVGDYGDILVMPMTKVMWENGAESGPDKGYASRFQKKNETATPGYYGVYLSDYGVQADMTTTLRCGLHRYDFGKPGTGHLMVDLRHRDRVIESQMQLVNDQEVVGFRRSDAWATDQHVYFVMRFSLPISQHVLRGEVSDAGKKSSGSAVQGAFSFDIPEQEALMVQVGISAVSIEGARKNLDAEMTDWDFERVRTEARDIWNAQLNKIVVEGGTEVQTRTFYSALYHTMIAPNLFSDVDGQYRGMDNAVHSAGKDKQYTVFSLWDTFRATHPLYTIIEQDRTQAFIRTFLRQYQDGGILPIWELAGNYTGCMIGYHAIPVITDAYAKGLRDFDLQLALKAMKHSAMQDQLGLAAYKAQGFIGAGDEAESVSKTLEYAYDDWCIAEMERLANGASTSDFQIFQQRAASYRNLFDPASGFFRAKMNGGWQKPFDPHEVNFNFTEANAWQYSLFVPQDFEGLIDLMGGDSVMEAHLDRLFSAKSQTTGRDQADITGLIGQYAHGNEPSHHMAYLYNFVGAPHKAQRRCREIMDNLYSDQPDGYSGNEDCGQMSAWYVMSALGMYPVKPGGTEYVFGSPLFPLATINLENGKRFRIRADGAIPEQPYIQHASLNGNDYMKLYLEHVDIMAGGELVFTMGDTPTDTWKSKEPQRPHSAIRGLKTMAVPYFEAESETFTDSLVVTIHSTQPGASLALAFGEDDPVWDADSTVELPFSFTITQTTEVRARVYAADHSEESASPIAMAKFYLIEGGRSLNLGATYANQYAAAGDNALIDYLRGGPNFRTGRWQGYREDLEAVVDLGEIKPIHYVGLGCLQDIKSWIWMPSEVEVSVSQDGKRYVSLGKLPSTVPDDQEGAVLEEIGMELQKAKSARYVRVRAKNYGLCPEWHLGAGGKTWLFVDEIVVR